MEIVSNRKAVLDAVINILKEEQFPLNDTIVKGVMSLVDNISDYSEEGHKLFPEILLLNSEYILKEIPCRHIRVYDKIMDSSQFSRTLKLCAPLAVDNWHIYMILKDEQHLEYGIMSTEIKETSVSLAKSFHSMLKDGNQVVYIRNVGGKNVEIEDSQRQIIVSLALDEDVATQDDNVDKLISVIISDCKDKHGDLLFEFFKKMFKGALNEGHGNLIAVCKIENIDECLNTMTDGARLEPTVNLPSLLEEDMERNLNQTSVAIKSYASVVKSMINHDGITIFSTTGQLLGFHYIVNNNIPGETQAVGGSRTKAFEALKQINCLAGRFFKSQDGITKFA